MAQVVLTHAPALISVAAERKAESQGAWVVRRARRDRSSAIRWVPIATVDIVDNLATLPWLLERHLPLGDPVAFSVVEPASNNGAFAAISQAVSAARGWLEQQPRAAITLPTVVLGGPQPVTLDHDPQGCPEAAAVDSIRVLWSSDQLSQPTVVHLVHEDALPGWARDLRHRLGNLADEILGSGYLPPL